MRDNPETLEQCIGDLVEASSVDDLARRCVGHLERMLPSTAISFDLIAQDGQEGEAVAAVGVSDYFLTRYEQIGRHQDPVLQRAVSRREISDNATFEREWCSLPIYRDVFSLHRLTNVLYAPVVLDGEVVATVDVGRGDVLGRFSDTELSMVRSFAAGVGATFASLSERRRLAREGHNLRAALDSCEEAVVLTDSVAGSRHLNAAARALLARRVDAEPSLDDLLRRSGAADGPPATATPVTLLDGSEATLRCRSAPLTDEPDVIVSVLSLEVEDERLARVVEASLTPREREVARLTVQGLRDSEIAERLMLSPHTVKHHLKSIYRKLGVRSRVELASLARRSAGPAASLE